MLVLERSDDPGQNEKRPQVLAMGEIVGKTTVLELIGMIITTAGAES